MTLSSLLLVMCLMLLLLSIVQVVTNKKYLRNRVVRLVIVLRVMFPRLTQQLNELAHVYSERTCTATSSSC